MGYTHYWRIAGTLDPEKLAIYSREVRRLVDLAPDVPIVGWDGEPGTKAEFAPDEIRFNGRGADAHETFSVTAGDTGFSFCKTARKPYDRIVTAALILMRKRFGNVAIESDGEPADWIEGLELARKVRASAAIPESITPY